MESRRTKRTAGFSLVELVIVIVIIGVIAAIAIPRVTQATKGAGESALSSDLAILRNAIEMYASEHNGSYPGQAAAGGTYGSAGTPEAFKAQLTMFSSASGEVNATRDADHPFGPYLRKGIPPLPVGAKKGYSEVAVDTTKSPPDAQPTANYGWIYNSSTGDIVANSNDQNDANTKAYSAY